MKTKDKIVSEAEVIKVVERAKKYLAGGQYFSVAHSDAFIWAYVLWYFGVKEISPSRTFYNGDETISSLKIETHSIILYPCITVKRKKRIDTTLIWMLSDLFGFGHCGGAGTGYMQICISQGKDERCLNRYHHIFMKNYKIKWLQWTQEFSTDLIMAFLAIKSSKVRKLSNH